MHIHQGHWSLSSSAWWTLLCNNQLIYILPSSAICVDYREKAMCVCARVRVSWRSVLYRFDTPCYWIYTLTPYMHTDSEEDFMHAHIGAHIFRRRLCLTPVSPLLPRSLSLPKPLPSGGQFLALILSRKLSRLARLCSVKNVRPSAQPPHICRAIFKVSKVWRRRLAAWQPCPRTPTLCQPWTGTVACTRLTNTLAVHVPFSCLICASQRQRNSLFIYKKSYGVVLWFNRIELIGNFTHAKVTKGEMIQMN